MEIEQEFVKHNGEKLYLTIKQRITLHYLTIKMEKSRCCNTIGFLEVEHLGEVFIFNTNKSKDYKELIETLDLYKIDFDIRKGGYRGNIEVWIEGNI